MGDIGDMDSSCGEFGFDLELDIELVSEFMTSPSISSSTSSSDGGWN